MHKEEMKQCQEQLKHADFLLLHWNMGRFFISLCAVKKHETGGFSYSVSMKLLLLLYFFVVQSVRLTGFQWKNNQFESEERRPHSLARTYTRTHSHHYFDRMAVDLIFRFVYEHEDSRASHIKLIFKQIAVRFVVTNNIISIVIIIKSMINSLY